MGALELAQAAARALDAKLGEEIVILDLGRDAPVADYFVLATASSTIHAQALAEAVRERLRAAGERAHHVEGLGAGTWVLLDYFDVVVHIFSGETRQFYGLERLWGDAPQVSFDNQPAAESAGRQGPDPDGGSRAGRKGGAD